MQITLLRKMRYEDTFICIMQFDTTFQYLFAVNGEIYQNNVEIKPKLKSWILWKIGKRKTPYTPDELYKGEKVILSGAMKTIDALKDKGLFSRRARRVRDDKIKEVEKERQAKRDIPCEWQSSETDDGWHWMCLVHGIAVKMVDGTKPKHEKL